MRTVGRRAIRLRLRGLPVIAARASIPGGSGLDRSALLALALVLGTGCLGAPGDAHASAPPAPARRAETPSAASAHAAPLVIADERGFTPSSLALRRDGPGRVVFRRTTDDTCATAVVFPALGLERELPLGQDVALELPTGEGRTLTFQCGMGMYRSTVLVQ